MPRIQELISRLRPSVLNSKELRRLPLNSFEVLTMSDFKALFDTLPDVDIIMTESGNASVSVDRYSLGLPRA